MGPEGAPVITIEDEVVVTCPREEVFALLANLEQAPRWNPRVLEARAVAEADGADDEEDEAPPATDEVGATFRLVEKPGRGISTALYEVKQREAPFLFSVAFSDGSTSGFETTTLEAAERGTRVRVERVVELRGLKRLLGFLERVRQRKRVQLQLMGLKLALEDR